MHPVQVTSLDGTERTWTAVAVQVLLHDCSLVHVVARAYLLLALLKLGSVRSALRCHHHPQNATLNAFEGTYQATDSNVGLLGFLLLVLHKEMSGDTTTTRGIVLGASKKPKGTVFQAVHYFNLWRSGCQCRDILTNHATVIRRSVARQPALPASSGQTRVGTMFLWLRYPPARGALLWGSESRR